MDAGGEQIGERPVDEALPRDARQARKGGAFHLHAKMAFARSVVAEMAGVKMAFVHHIQRGGRERIGKARRDLVGDGRGDAGIAVGGRYLHRAYIVGFREKGCRTIVARGERKDRSHQRFHGRIVGERPCAEPGCDAAGEFRAPPLEGPGRREGPPDFRWFCLDHIRAFNARYNFFDGMTADEIHSAQRPLAGWERETRAFARAGAGDTGPRWADFADPLDAIGARYRREVAPERSDGKPLSGQDRASLKVMGLAPDADRPTLKRRYSELVRRYHPDRNGGDRRHEDRLQQVIAAYQQLRQAPAFA